MLYIAAILSILAAPAAPVDLTSAPGVETAIVTEGQGYFPVVDKTPDGRAVVILRGGGGHIGIGGRLDLLFSQDGLTWTNFKTAIDTSADDRNPAFGITPDGRFLLGIHHQAGYTGHGLYNPKFKLSRDMQVYSDDEGSNWSSFLHVELGEVGTTSPYGRIIRLSDGTYLQNVYGARAPAVPGIPEATETVRDYAYVVRSTDEGETWSDPSLVAAGHNETALLELEDGSIIAAARDDLNGAHLDIFRSEDLGRTWAHVIKATDKSQHPADLVNLGDDVIIMLYGNRRDKEKDIRGILSRDGGKTWDTSTELSLTEPVKGDFGYPSGVVMGDKLLILHYWAGPAASSYDGAHAQCRATLIPIAEIVAER